MKTRCLVLLITAVAALSFFAHRNLRLWRDTIFYSQDVSAFILPNGVEVPTNRWLSGSSLLEGHSRFAYVATASDDGHYNAPFHLSFFDSDDYAYAETAEAEGSVTNILVTSYTVHADGYTKHHVILGDKNEHHDRPPTLLEM